jgi:thioredoxin reductase
MDGSRYDVVIVGGGPAGLSAALVLGRCRRRVLVCDAGNPRNVCSEGVHGFLTRDGTRPSELLAIARQELQPYGVEMLETTVMAVEPRDGEFVVRLRDESTVTGRKILLATGVIDRLPKIPDIEQYYGRSIHHCPYCDGWEHSDGRIAVYGKTRGAVTLAVKMKVWTADVVLCTGGPARLPNSDLERLARLDIRVVQKRITRLEGTPPQLARIIFEDGTAIDRSGIFFATGNVQRSELVARLGCEMTAKGAVRSARGQRTSVPGVFIAGDAAHDSQYVIVAAAHGARAAMAINNDLIEQDLR